MRVFLISLFFAVSASNSAIAAVSCSPTVPTDGCEVGCYANAGTCQKCPLGKYSNKGSTELDDCKPCTNVPTGATSTGPGTSATSCPWTITCAAGTEWKNSKCQTCGDNTISAQTTITYDGSTTSGNSSCTGCGTGKYANEAHTACLSYVYTITLNNNCENCVQNCEFFEKYDVGFSNTKTGTFVSGSSFTANINNCKNRFGYNLDGYYTSEYGGTLKLKNNGKLEDTSNTQFIGDTTLYARWTGKEYTINYTGSNAPAQQKCTFGGTCKIASPTKADNCYVFDGWKCTNGCTEQIIIQPNTTFDTAYISASNLTITLVAQWSVCPNGYYCKNGKKTACPYAGTTTQNTATQCATENTQCYISSATQFRDKNDTPFTLPIPNINYSN